MTVLVQDPDLTIHVGDALETLRTLPDGSVDCCVTSPPYWGLRDYGTGSWEGGDEGCDHIRQTAEQMAALKRNSTLIGAGYDSNHQYHAQTYRDVCGKCGARRVDRQLGLESSPDEYVAAMVGVFGEVRRVLADSGTLWLNLGDSYAPVNYGPNAKLRRESPGSDATLQGQAGHWAADIGGARSSTFSKGAASVGIKQKDLVGIPWRVAFALQADGWYLRSDIIWSKPNPMPESVRDRPTKAHEYVFLLSKQPRYWFDQEAVRERYLDGPGLNGGAYSPPGQSPHGNARGPDGRHVTAVVGQDGSLQHRNGERWPNPTGRNVRSVWEIATEPYPEAHFATFPTELARRCILAGCPEWVCGTCGKPYVRDLEIERDDRSFDREQTAWASSARRADGSRLTSGTGHRTIGGSTPSYRPPKITTTGWGPTCECHLADSETPAVSLHGLSGAASRGEGERSGDVRGVQGVSRFARPGVVLDPFLGSGTTALVARQQGRSCVGIELNPTYAQLAARRCQQLSLLAEATT